MIDYRYFSKIPLLAILFMSGLTAAAKTTVSQQVTQPEADTFQVDIIVANDRPLVNFNMDIVFEPSRLSFVPGSLVDGARAIKPTSLNLAPGSANRLQYRSDDNIAGTETIAVCSEPCTDWLFRFRFSRVNQQYGATALTFSGIDAQVPGLGQDSPIVANAGIVDLGIGAVTVAPPTGVYNSAQPIQITADGASRILFTLDGNAPDPAPGSTDPDFLVDGPFPPLNGNNGDIITIKALAINAAGTTKSAESVVTFDKVAPAIVIHGVSNGQVSASAVTPVVSVNDAHPGTLTITLDGITFQSGTPVSAEGMHQLVANAVDLAGNANTRQLNFQINFAAPLITITGVTDGLITNADVTPIITVENSVATTIRLNDNPFASGTIISLPDQFEQEFTLEVNAQSSEGTPASAEITFVIDKVRPVIERIDALTPSGSYRVGNVIDFRLTFSEPVSLSSGTLMVRFNSTGTASIIAFGSTTIVFGKYTVRANENTALLDVTDLAVVTGTLTDAAGNQADIVSLPGTTIATGKTIRIDTIAPSVTVTSDASDPTNANPIPVTVTISETVTDFTVGDIIATNGAAQNFAGSGATYSFALAPGGQGLVAVDIAEGVAHDSAGNGNSVAAPFSRLFDSVAPTIADISIATTGTLTPGVAIIGQTVSLTFRADGAAGSPSVNIAGLSATVESPSGGSTLYSARRSMTAADPEGIIAFSIAASDGAGNQAQANATTNGSFAVMVHAAWEHRFSFGAGWNLFSLPGGLVQSEPASLQSAGITPAWRWSGNRFVTVPTLNGETGYWIFMRSATSVIIRGRNDDVAGTPVASGWNLVGIDNVLGLDLPLPMVAIAWEWDGTRLRPALRLERFYGYWIHSGQGGTIGN